MSATFDKVRELVRQRRVRLSQHGFNRITRRGILLADVIAGTANGEPIEDYPDYYTGPAVLVLQSDNAGKPQHVVWGLEKGTVEPAVLITAYYPDPAEWAPDFRSRRT